jgi:hypothetical protein
MTRPELNIDWEKADELLISGCLGTEVAAFFGMHPDTFYKRVEKKYNVGFSAYMQQKRSSGEALLRAQQFAKALGISKKGDNMMLIWLGKNRLGQSDHQEKEESPKQDDLDLKQKHYAVLFENQQLKEKINAIKPEASQELQRSDTQV